MQGKLIIEKGNKRQVLDFGTIDKRDYELLVKRYKSLGYQIKEEKDVV